MRKRTIASKIEKHWTVLLVDGQGRIRRIPHFRRKMWIVAGLSMGALALAVALGLLYGGMLQKYRALSEEKTVLQDSLVALRQQNELLKARAVRLETLVDPAKEAAAQEPAPEAASSPRSDAAAPPAQPAPPPAPEPEDVQPAASPKEDTTSPASSPEAGQVESEKELRVDAEGLAVDFRADTETIAAQFVIKNTGDIRAEGRAVVVLETEAGSSQLRLALPTVPLRDGRPLGNRGRRFSISRFMTVDLERKFAEPGTQFVGAVVYAYTLEGRSLLEKPFSVTLSIPEKEPAPAAVPAAAPLGLNLPEPEPEETTGVQP